MPIVPLRDLGKLGVITDVDPYDLPANAFSFAKNVRFEDNKILRGHVFRSVGPLSTAPRHLIGYARPSGAFITLYVSNDGRVRQWAAGTDTDKSPAGWAGTITSSPITSCVLNNVIYVNRGDDHIPWWRTKESNGAFAGITINDATQTQWRSDWRCRVLRSLSGVLIAANVKKGANHYPNMVKWSNFSYEVNTQPLDWDYANPSSNAGENTLAEMDGEIIDAFPLRNRMYLYGDTETWIMEFIGGVSMFRFDRQFDKGIISTNCVAEVGGAHYIFGPNDIWLHDGTSDKMIARGKNRKFIYEGLVSSRKGEFFVLPNKRTHEILFAYVSNDKYCKWPSSAGYGCNRGAIYNIPSQTWTFVDLPYVTAGALTMPDDGSGVTFANVGTPTYQTIGGSFASLEQEQKLNMTLTSSAVGNIPRALRTFEIFEEASSRFDLDPVANAPAYLERTGLDMDELGAELRGYKLISSIYPQGRLDPDSAPLVFTFGVSDHATEAPTWGEPQTWDQHFYKLDFNQAGRFLHYKMEQEDVQPFTLTGVDLDVLLLGRY